MTMVFMMRLLESSITGLTGVLLRVLTWNLRSGEAVYMYVTGK